MAAVKGDVGSSLCHVLQRYRQRLSKREVEEELGTKLGLVEDRLEWLCDVRIARGSGAVWISYFTYSLDLDMNELTLQKHGKVEGEVLGWFDAEEIHHLQVRPEDRIALNDFFWPTAGVRRRPRRPTARKS